MDSLAHPNFPFQPPFLGRLFESGLAVYSRRGTALLPFLPAPVLLRCQGVPGFLLPLGELVDDTGQYMWELVLEVDPELVDDRLMGQLTDASSHGLRPLEVYWIIARSAS